MTKNPSQSGSAFFIILIAIFMFAALSYALMQGSRTSAANLTAEQARLAAQEILSYADTVSKTVHKLRLSGCSETQINFVTPDTAAWMTNPLAPSDKSCDVFDMAGGKVNYEYIPEAARKLTDPTAKYWWFNSELRVQGIGTTNTELVLWATDLKYEVCVALNKILMDKLPWPEVTATNTTGFVGTYVPLANGFGDDPGSPYNGKAAGCMGDTSWSAMYYTVIAR